MSVPDRVHWEQEYLAAVVRHTRRRPSADGDRFQIDRSDRKEAIKKSALKEFVDVSTLPEDEKNCSICLDTLTMGHEIAADEEETRWMTCHAPLKTSCGHVFGAQCLWTWLYDHEMDTCPYCRKDLLHQRISRVNSGDATRSMRRATFGSRLEANRHNRDSGDIRYRTPHIPLPSGGNYGFTPGQQNPFRAAPTQYGAYHPSQSGSYGSSPFPQPLGYAPPHVNNTLTQNTIGIAPVAIAIPTFGAIHGMDPLMQSRRREQTTNQLLQSIRDRSERASTALSPLGPIQLATYYPIPYFAAPTSYRPNPSVPSTLVAPSVAHQQSMHVFSLSQPLGTTAIYPCPYPLHACPWATQLPSYAYSRASTTASYSQQPHMMVASLPQQQATTHEMQQIQLLQQMGHAQQMHARVQQQLLDIALQKLTVSHAQLQATPRATATVLQDMADALRIQSQMFFDEEMAYLARHGTFGNAAPNICRDIKERSDRQARNMIGDYYEALNVRYRATHNLPVPIVQASQPISSTPAVADGSNGYEQLAVWADSL